jgi:hypothetical protein
MAADVSSRLSATVGRSSMDENGLPGVSAAQADISTASSTAIIWEPLKSTVSP